MAAALMMSAQIHPSTCMPRELTRFPITRRSLVSSRPSLEVSQFDQTFVLAASMMVNSKEANSTLQTSPASSYR
jgi:hypothetical protein